MSYLQGLLYVLKWMAMKNQFVFFLGGHDLEMLEIRRLLEKIGLKEGIHFYDHQLRWGASLQDYEGLFSKHKTNVCIELQEDIPPPALYHRIDHHNAGFDLPSSIEQLAELLGISLTRHQLLVAANDRAYIVGMQRMGASPAEIDAIRQKDRKAQGVSEADEAQAILDVQAASTRGCLTLVKTGLKRFSPIADRLYQRPHLLIYNEHELTYYGPARDVLVKHYQSEIQAKKAYYGGETNGFFGFGKGAFNPPDIQKTVEEMTNMVNIYSG